METYQLVRSIPVEKGYDVVVAGGGPAGSAAAICAARLGAKVLLVEATANTRQEYDTFCEAVEDE